MIKATSPKIEFRQIRSVTETINVSTEFVRQNIKLLLKSLVIVASPFVLFVFLLNSILIFLTLGVDLDDMANNILDYVTSGFFQKLFIFIALFVFSFSMFLATIYEYMLLYKTAENFQNISVTDVSKRVFKDLWLFASTTFLLSIAFFFGSLFLLLIAFMLPLLGIFLFYGAFSYALMALSMIYIMRLVERNSFWTAFRRCFYLLRNHFWTTFGLFILTFFITNCLSFAPSLLVAGLSGLLETVGLNYLTIIITILQMFVSLISLLTNALFCLVIAFRYFSLVELKEGIGILEKIDQIGVVSTTQ